MKKLILIDSDETLRRTDGSISEKTKEVIKKLIGNGNYVVICTGRPRYHTKKIMKMACSSPIIISSNGAEIYDNSTNQIINSSFVDKEECYKLIDYAINNDLRLIVSVGDYEYVTKNIRNDNQLLFDLNNYKDQLKDKNIYQCMVVDNKIEEVEKMKQLVNSSEKIRVKNGLRENEESDVNWFTVGSIEATKGYALIKLANYLNIPIENTISIGNDYNDISMFQEAGFSICVANGVDEVKKYADHITLSNDEDGVAIVLEKILKESIEC